MMHQSRIRFSATRIDFLAVPNGPDTENGSSKCQGKPDNEFSFSNIWNTLIVSGPRFQTKESGHVDVALNGLTGSTSSSVCCDAGSGLDEDEIDGGGGGDGVADFSDAFKNISFFCTRC